MSATTFIPWRVLYMAGCVLQGAVLMEIRMSKACYGTPGLRCTRHSIRCNPTQKITIVDAYFTFNRECGAAIADCQHVNPDNVPSIRGSNSFDNTDLLYLYSNCSTESQCGYPAPRHGEADTFSIVEYRCIKEDLVIPITEAPQRNTSEATIIYKHSDEMPDSTYTCTVQSQTPVNVTALDIRLGEWNEPTNCSLLTVTKTPYTCSSLIEPYKQLATIQSSGFITLQVKEGTRPVVWLRFTSTRNFFIRCGPTFSTTSSVTVTETMGTSTESPNTTGSSSNKIGAIIGAVVGTLLFVAVVFVFLWYWRNRKVDKKPIPQLPRRTTLDGQRNKTHSAKNNPQQTSYDEIDDLRQHLASNYDYVTSNHVIDSNAYFILETEENPMMSNNGSNPEDQYNHIGQGLSPASGTYDTTASAAKSMMSNNGSDPEDQYNHIGQGLSPVSGTYDTTASAAKSMMTNNGSDPEDEYNHIGQGLSPVSGTYDTRASATKQVEQGDSSPADACYDHLKQKTPTEHISNAYDVAEKHPY